MKYNKKIKRTVKTMTLLPATYFGVQMSAYLMLASIDEDKAVLPRLKKQSGR